MNIDNHFFLFIIIIIILFFIFFLYLYLFSLSLSLVFVKEWRGVSKIYKDFFDVGLNNDAT